MALILNYNNRTSLYSKKAGGTYTETPKTETSYRTLKLPDEVMEMLLKWKGLQDIQRRNVDSKWIETDRVFTKWNGLTLDRSAPGYYFERSCERTGMRYVSNHSMRHLNASLLINAGVDVKTVQSCLGHSMAATTIELYE
ncbi:MAG: site-specific integrase [Oscillospiraceae bacterium]